MFQLKDDSAFKQHLRDFLVQTKSFADKNNADLYAEEAAQQREVGVSYPLLHRFTSAASWQHGVQHAACSCTQCLLPYCSDLSGSHSSASGVEVRVTILMLVAVLLLSNA